jgi:hypothetical protein
LTTVTVKVRHTEVTHVVRMQDFENWLNRGCRSPAETVLKGRCGRYLGCAKNNNKEDRMDQYGASSFTRATSCSDGSFCHARTDCAARLLSYCVEAEFERSRL